MGGDFVIGKIAGTHGIKGEIKIYPTTDDATRFSLLTELRISIKNTENVYEIENIRYQKGFPIVKLKGLDSIEETQFLKNGEILIDEKNALPLGEDEYYLRDLLGAEVFTEEGEELGIISEIISTGANDVYIVKKEGTKDLLIPAIKQCVLAVNVSEKKVIVKLMEGLR